MRSRVMPGSLVTMERRVPVKRLKSVDLPTLGRPTMTRDGSFGAMRGRGRMVRNRGGGAILHCTVSGIELKAVIEGRPGRQVPGRHDEWDAQNERGNGTLQKMIVKKKSGH